MSNHDLSQAIRQQYGDTARSSLTNDDPGVQAIARAFGYTAAELATIPKEANMGLSCGNPIATAHLKPGETLVDLGSGGGLDVFLAAAKVGPAGKAIGIDMTPAMIARAKAAAAAGVNGQPITNVEFHLASIEQLPLPDATADVITSNCVINLATDKSAVFREMFRVLKPAGRVAVSDIALKQPLPEDLARDIHAYVGCIAGAMLMDDYEKQLRNAGFTEVMVVDTQSDLNAYGNVQGQSVCCSPPSVAASPSTGGLGLNVLSSSSCCEPGSSTYSSTPVHDQLAVLMRKYNINDYAASVKVFAVKPG